eukprot:484603_1
MLDSPCMHMASHPHTLTFASYGFPSIPPWGHIIGRITSPPFSCGTGRCFFIRRSSWSGYMVVRATWCNDGLEGGRMGCILNGVMDYLRQCIIVGGSYYSYYSYYSCDSLSRISSNG